VPGQERGGGDVQEVTDSLLRMVTIIRRYVEDITAGPGDMRSRVSPPTADFVAVTRGHRFENLVPRRAAVNAVLLSVASGGDHRNGRECERKT
jgi:hypothetical protein